MKAKLHAGARPIDCGLFGISRGGALFGAGYDFITPTTNAWMLADAATGAVAAMRASQG